MRVTLRLRAPTWFAQPYDTSSIRVGSTDVLRAINAFCGMAARSSARA